MRLLEIVLVSLWAISLLEGFLAKGRRSWWSVLWGGSAGLLALVQIFVELPRWPLLLVYSGVLVNMLIVLAGLISPRRPWEEGRRPHRVRRFFAGLFALSFWTAATAAGVLFPVPVFPAPTGPYAVGTTQFEWVDSSRTELYTSQSGKFRDLLVKVWYPAAETGISPQMGWPDLAVLAPVAARAQGFPDFFLNQYSLTKTHAQPEAPLAASGGPFPVLLFSPGYGMIVTANTAQAEDLASHGYVVFGIGHPYQNAVVYPDGRVVLPINEDKWQKLSPGEIEARNHKASELRQAATAATDPALKMSLAEQAMALYPVLEANSRLWTDDSRFVLDQVVALQTGSSRFSGHLDLERVGAWGQSFGGSTAGLLILNDPRVRAGVNLDGQQWGLHGQPLSRPFLLMATDTGGKADAGTPMYDASPGPYYVLWIKGTTHQNYTDLSLVSPLFPLLGFLGPVEPGRLESLLNQYLVGFFDQTLRGDSSQLLQKPVQNREYELRVRNP